MFEKLNYIELSGVTYPIKCDMAVLEQIQEKYGDLQGFEKKIYRFHPTLDENGVKVTNEEGLAVGTLDYPDVGAVADALFWMVSEGLEIEAEAAGKEMREVSRKELLRKIDASPIDIGDALHDEYVRCFQRKNVRTTQNQEKRKKAGTSK